MEKGTYGICRDCGEPIAAAAAERHSLDARLHHLQGKAKLVKATELLALLREFYRDKLAMRQRHVAVAKHVAHYDFNNTYQYVITREDVQLNWLRDAIIDMGGELEDVPEPAIATSGKESRRFRRSSWRRIATPPRSFVDKWRPRIDGAAQRASSDHAARHPR